MYYIVLSSKYPHFQSSALTKELLYCKAVHSSPASCRLPRFWRDFGGQRKVQVKPPYTVQSKNCIVKMAVKGVAYLLEKGSLGLRYELGY